MKGRLPSPSLVVVSAEARSTGSRCWEYPPTYHGHPVMDGFHEGIGAGGDQGARF